MDKSVFFSLQKDRNVSLVAADNINGKSWKPTFGLKQGDTNGQNSFAPHPSANLTQTAIIHFENSQ